MPKSRRIMMLSDGTGETAAQMVKAAMLQFSTQDVSYARFKNVRTEEQIQAILADADPAHDVVAFTLVSPELRNHLFRLARDQSLLCIDLLGPLLTGLATAFEFEPQMTAGLLHGVNENYFQRIDAMEYTIAHDDGRDLTGLDKADLVILGISRTSKTPLSMYLSHQGWRVANVPLILGFPVPDEIASLDQRRVIALTIDPEDLSQIRMARLQRLGHDKGGDYAALERVNQEIEWANEIYRKHRAWPVFNVTGKALEETAFEIIRLMASRRLTPPGTLENMSPLKKNT